MNLDDVLDVTLWPLPEQYDESRAKRRIGVGFTGLGDALVMLGLRYNSPEGRDLAVRIARLMRDEAYRASVELARERGAFALFDAKRYLEDGTFASRLPDDLKDAIRRDGIRNSHLLSIAPTGTSPTSCPRSRRPAATARSGEAVSAQIVTGRPARPVQGRRAAGGGRPADPTEPTPSPARR